MSFVKVPDDTVWVTSTGETYVELPSIKRCPECELTLYGGQCPMCGWPMQED